MVGRKNMYFCVLGVGDVTNWRMAYNMDKE